MRPFWKTCVDFWTICKQHFFRKCTTCTVNFLKFSNFGFNSKNALRYRDYGSQNSKFASFLSTTCSRENFANACTFCTFLASTFERVHVSCKGSREIKKYAPIIAHDWRVSNRGVDLCTWGSISQLFDHFRTNFAQWFPNLWIYPTLFQTFGDRSYTNHSTREPKLCSIMHELTTFLGKLFNKVKNYCLSPCNWFTDTPPPRFVQKILLASKFASVLAFMHPWNFTS